MKCQQMIDVFGNLESTKIFLRQFTYLCRTQKQSKGDRSKLEELDKNMIKRKAQLYEIEQSLPQKNSVYLKVKVFC